MEIEIIKTHFNNSLYFIIYRTCHKYPDIIPFIKYYKDGMIHGL